MPKRLHKALTPASVRAAGPGKHADGGGLYLQVHPQGSRSWVFRPMVAGKRLAIGLGPVAGANAVSLAKAREAARALADELAAGGVPVSPTKRRKQAMQEEAGRVTFRTLAERHIATMQAQWRNPKHRQQWTNTLATYAYPHIGDLSVADIQTADVVRVLEPIWLEKAETARRVRSRVEAVLHAAKALGYRNDDNPARWDGHLKALLPAGGTGQRGQHKSLTYVDLPTFWRELKEREGMAALALQFAILTAARSGEVRGMRWDEFDLDAGLWTVPAERMKAGREHRVPLSTSALALLRNVEVFDCGWVFPSPTGRQLSDMALTKVLRRMGTDVTAHGFRSTFRTWAAEQTGVQREVAEAALAHAIESKTEAAYQRGDLLEKRRRLMVAWAKYCTGERAAGAKVTPIRTATA